MNDIYNTDIKLLYLGFTEDPEKRHCGRTGEAKSRRCRRGICGDDAAGQRMACIP